MSTEKIDFDTVLNRRHTNCGRWDTMDQKYKKTDMIHLGVADMDFKSPDAIIGGFQKILDHGVFGYTDLSSQFYESIMGWMKKRNGLEINKEHIVFCPRINIASSICIDTYTQPGDEVIINTPAYAPLYQAIVKNGRIVVESPLFIEGERYRIDFEHLESVVNEKTKMFILCSPHNPVSRVWTKEELSAVGEFCVKHNLILFADEIHSDILAEGIQFTSVLDLSDTVLQQVILATSLTKTFNIPGTIVSYMIIQNDSLRASIRMEIDRIGMHNPTIFAVSAVEEGYTKCDKWYTEMIQYIDANEAFTREYFARNMPGFHILPREGTYLLWINYKDLGCTEQELENWFLQKANVSVYMGSVFGTQGIGYLRLNIASPKALLLEAYERMHAVYPMI